MKTITSLIAGIIIISFSAFSQKSELSFSKIKNTADLIASSTWGNTFSGEAIPLYSLQDETIAYLFNYSINKPFPQSNQLIKDLQNNELAHKDGRWADGKFGYMIMSAKQSTTPLITFCKVISDYYAYAPERDQLAKEKFGNENFSLYKVYYMHDLAKWYCYKSGEKKVYVKIFPPQMALSEIEFEAFLETKKAQKPGLWQLPQDDKNEWQQFLSGPINCSKADILIPNEELVPFYDWSFGCTPTAFTMALAYWDNLSMISGNDYGNLVKYHYQRWDQIQFETDLNVADLQLSLCISMGTDSVSTGGTGSSNWLNGMINAVAARGYSFTGSDLYGSTAQYWLWAINEIASGRPFHLGTPDHSNTGVGYSENYVGSDDYIIRHDTWQPTHSYINITTCDLVGTIIPGGEYGNGVSLTDPFGDPRYSDNVWGTSQGEDLWAGDAYEITWDYEYLSSAYAKLFYSTNGGNVWNFITSYTPNDGSYDWIIPLGLNSTNGRIMVEIWDGATHIAADGSWGNFTFNPGGYLPTLGGDIKENTITEPDYYDFTHNNQTWCAVGVRANTAGDDWDIQMFNNNSFSNAVTASTYGGSIVDFVVMDGHHTSQLYRGIKTYRYFGTGTASVEFEGYNEILIEGTNADVWDAGDVVEMYDVYLTAGTHYFELEFSSGTADLDMALYQSNGTPYFEGSHAYIANSTNSGGGIDESFYVTITTPDYYGLCVFANDENSAYYNINLLNGNVWLGTIDNNWHDPGNWASNTVPDATTDVIIRDAPYKCWVYGMPAFCKNITIEYSSGYTFRIWDQYLDVSGNMNIYGQLMMDHEDGSIDAHGDIIWESGSSASILANTIIEVGGDWIFKLGANVALNNGQVVVTGAGNSYIRTFEENCNFNDLVVFKSSPNWASIGSTNTANINIHGDLVVQPSTLLYMYTPQSVIIYGDFINLGSFLGYDGTLTLSGSEQAILSLGTTTIINNLKINSIISTEIFGNGMQVSGDLVIENGQLNSNGQTFSVGRDWDNQVGPGGFIADTGRVIFNGGDYHQYCSDEYFNILELDKPLGGAFRMQGTHVTCGSYDWTAGAIDVIIGGGSFTAFDLADDAIYGEYYLNPGGMINLFQDMDPGSYVDLNGELHIFGGEMHVYGGTTPSYWPFAGNALISMYDGILDFHDQGIYIYNSSTYSLTESITGGIIRTSGGFWGESNEFTPEYGTIEFYGPNDVDIFTLSGCYLNDILINKTSSKESEQNTESIPQFDAKSGKPIGNGSKSNTLNMIEFLDINGSLVIANGVLSTNGFNMHIEGDWLNFVGDAGFIESTGWVTFNDDDNVGSVIHTNETFNNLMLLSTASGIHGLTILDGLEVNVLNSLDLQLSSLNIGFTSTLNIGGNIFIANEAGLNADDGDILIRIGGNWTNENNPNTMFEGFWPGGETVIFDGLTDQMISVTASEETFNNLVINKTSGEFKPNDNIQVLGNLNIQYGDWRDNVPLLSHSFYGDFMIEADGNYYPEYETCFKGESDQVYETFGGDGIFKKLVIDKTPAKNSFGYKGGGSKSMTLTLNSDMVVHDGYGTSIDEGNLFLNGHLFNPTSHMYMEDGSAIIVNEGATLVLSTGLFMNGGEFITYGSPGNKSTITKGAVGEYQFQVNGGIISANHTLFEGMNDNGIWITGGAIVDINNAFNNCIFGAGINTSGSLRLTINNDQSLNLDHVSFIDNPYIFGTINVGKFNNQGELNFTNFNGNFSGFEYEDDQYDRIHWIPNEYRIQAKVFLEGCFNVTQMTPELNPVLPLNHPFNPPLPYFGNPLPDWYFNIPGTAPSIPDPTVVDWVLVQLRDASSPGAALPATSIATAPAFLLEDGSIIGMDGSGQLTFEVTPVNNIYLVVWHRNHLGIIAANPLTEIGGLYPYDFTSTSSQTYGGSSAQVQLSSVPEIWGMMAGDGDGNGEVDDPDKLNIWNLQTGEQGYLESDYNLNKNVNNQDKNDFWYLNYGKATYIPE